MTTIKTSVALMALSAGVAACGSTVAATSGKPPALPVTSTVSAACNPHNPVPPKTQPKTPKANLCWAGNFFVGEWSLHNKRVIFADKMANYSADQLTPQLIRTDPAKAIVVEKVLAEYATPAAQTQIQQNLNPLAKAGDTLVTTGKNPKDPTGLISTYPVILTGGVSSIPSGNNSPVPSQAQVGECVNEQLYVVGPNNLPLPGLPGYFGDVKWTDELVKTSTGWQVSQFSVGLKEVSSC